MESKPPSDSPDHAALQICSDLFLLSQSNHYFGDSPLNPSNEYPDCDDFLLTTVRQIPPKFAINPDRHVIHEPLRKRQTADAADATEARLRTPGF